MAEHTPAAVEHFLEQCKQSSDKAYSSLKAILEKLHNPSTRKEARVFLTSVQKQVDSQLNAPDSLSIYHFRIHQLSLTGYEGFHEERESLLLLELPSIFIPEAWSFTFFEGINRLPENTFHDRHVAELGCGNGWISIALAEKWSPRKMYGLDINPRAIKAAWINLYLNALDEDGSPIVDHEGRTLLDKVEFHESDLLAYCRNNNISLDRIIGCIPQILSPDPHAMQKIVSENASEEFLYSLSNYCALQGFVEDQFGLGLIARAAEEGIAVIKPSGTMIFNIGGRPGQAVCERLFKRRGFHITKLWQTRVNQAADTDILALVEIENNSRHRFEFFMGRVSEEPVCARTAWAYAKSGGEISHGLSVYSCRLQQPSQVKTIFKFLANSPQETRSALDLSFDEESVAEEKIPFLAHLACALEETSHIPYELPVGSARFRNLIAGFMRFYHNIPISHNNIMVFPSRSVAIETFLSLFSPDLAVVDGSLSKFLPRKWVTTIPSQHTPNGLLENLCGSNITVIEAPRRVDLVLQLLHHLRPQIVVANLADFEMKSSTAFELLLSACEEVGCRLLLDISDHIEISSLPGSNGVLQYLTVKALPVHATIVCGLLKNKVYSDLEVAFIISENQYLLQSMARMEELLNGGTAISSQFYYGCLFHELLTFQLPARYPMRERLPMVEEAAQFIKVAKVMQECLLEAEMTDKEHSSDKLQDSSEYLLATPTAVKMTLFESFARQNITDSETDPTPEICEFLSSKLGILLDASSEIVLSDSFRALFSKLITSCIENGGTLLFPAGSHQAYVDAAKLLGVEVRIIQTKPDDSFKLTEELTAQALESTYKPWLYVTGPTIYPTGSVYSKSEIEGLISMCLKNGAQLIVDTSFSGLEYGLSGPAAWDLEDIDCSSMITIGNFSSELLMGGLEFCFALLQNSAGNAFRESAAVNRPHGTLRYTMKKLLNMYNQKEGRLYKELAQQREILHHRAQLLFKVLQECGWEPLEPLGGVSLIARPVAYEGKTVSYLGQDSSETQLTVDSSNLRDAISKITGLWISKTSWTCIPGYYQFGFATEEDDFGKVLEALKKFKAAAF